MIGAERLFAPRDTAAAAQMMAEAAQQKLRLTFAGGGTERELGNPGEAVDAVLSTEHLGRVLDYAPADMTISVEAGMTLASVQAAVNAHGQRLALDAPAAQRATIGGLIATNACGPRRARFGSIRDGIVGVSLVRADGALARGGGKVVKNVAGFDLPKLMVGSLGTLGLIVSATFRLHPLPQAGALVVLRLREVRQLARLAALLVDEQLEPSSILAFRRAHGFDAAVLFEGFPAGVEEQRARCVAEAQAAGLTSGDAADGEGPAFESEHERIRSEGSLRLKITFAPAALVTIEDEVLSALGAAFETMDCVLYPTLGIAFTSAHIDAEGGDAALRALSGARRVVEGRGGALTLCAAPAGVRGAFDAWGDPGEGFELMRALKDRFDPERRLNPGRFVGGI